MKLNKQLAIVGIFCFLCFAAVAGVFYLSHYKKIQTAPANNAPGEQNYAQLVTPEDRKPLEVSPQAVKNGRTLTVPILMYHHVGGLPKNANKTRVDLTVPTVNFTAEVKWLRDSGYTGISLKDIYLFSQGRFTMPKKPVVFTFDDGYADVFQNAVPILKQYGFFGNFAIITNNPGTAQGGNIYASWADIAKAYQAGNEIISHTQNHFDGSNPKFSANFIYQNLADSVAAINQHLGFTTNILIYPYGHYTDAYLAQAKNAGFVMGVTVHEGDVINLDDLMRIPRVRVHGAETLQRFEDILLLGPRAFVKPTSTSTPATTTPFK